MITPVAITEMTKADRDNYLLSRSKFLALTSLQSMLKILAVDLERKACDVIYRFGYLISQHERMMLDHELKITIDNWWNCFSADVYRECIRTDIKQLTSENIWVELDFQSIDNGVVLKLSPAVIKILEMKITEEEEC